MHKGTKILLAIAAITMQADARIDPAIEKTAESYRKAVLAGDAAAVAATYRVDAVEMPPCRSPLKGRMAIEQYYRGLFAGPMKITDFTFTHVETTTAGNLGYVIGTYTQKLASKSGAPVEDTGNFVVIVKHDGGSWKAAYLIYNSHLPPAMPAAAPAAYSPWLALRDYYAAVAPGWIIRLALFLLACALFTLAPWLIRRFWGVGFSPRTGFIRSIGRRPTHRRVSLTPSPSI